MDLANTSLNAFEKAKMLMPTKSVGTIVGFGIIGFGVGAVILGAGVVFVFNK